MKKAAFIILASVFVCLSCDKGKDRYDYSDIFLFFGTAIEFKAEDAPKVYNIPVRRSMIDKSTKTISFVVVDDNSIEVGQRAQEGVDYVIPSKTINFPDGDWAGYTPITVNPVATPKKIKLRMTYSHPNLMTESRTSETVITILPKAQN